MCPYVHNVYILVYNENNTTMCKNIDGSHQHNDGQIQPVREKYILCNSICIKFKGRINKATPLVVRLDLSLED